MPVLSYWPLPAPAAAVSPAQAAPALDEDAFLGLLQNLLPRGRAWPREADAILTQLLRGLGKRQEAIHSRQLDLLFDAFPSQAAELLPEWEETLGLPDPCAGTDVTFAARQAHVAAHTANRGGQSVPYLVAYAADLGYQITITEFTPSRFGMRFGGCFRDSDWANALQINAPPETVHYFHFGADRFGDYFGQWGNAVLECEIRRVAPGQAVLIFSYA